MTLKAVDLNNITRTKDIKLLGFNVQSADADNVLELIENNYLQCVIDFYADESLNFSEEDFFTEIESYFYHRHVHIYPIKTLKVIRTEDFTSSKNLKQDKIKLSYNYNLIYATLEENEIFLKFYEAYNDSVYAVLYYKFPIIGFSL